MDRCKSFFYGVIFCVSIIFLITYKTILLGQETSAFIRGADISFVPQIEDNGGVYKDSSIVKDPLVIFKNHGINYIRLKLWHTPAENYNNLPRILEMATRIKQHGLKFLLNFHYSDTWADPGSQTKPAAWQGASFSALTDSVYFYTLNVMKVLDAQGTLPDMVQIGNEINSGMLWNDGNVGGSNDTPTQWAKLAALINAGIQAVRESSVNGDSVKIMIHRAGFNGNTWFFDNLINNGVDFDVIGLSFYPWWHGTISAAQSTLNSLAGRYGKELVIAETAYPWTLNWYDNVNNIVGNTSQLHAGYGASVSGQAKFIQDVIKVVRNTNNSKGIGIFYWAPEYISVLPLGSPWENLALFDFQGNALQSLNAFKELSDSSKPVNVTITVNTATNWDTLNQNHFVQLRGNTVGIFSGDLPDGKKLTWDSDSDIILENIGGDYWQTTFQLNSGSEISYKFWTGYDKNTPTYQRLGLEGPVTAFNGTATNTRNLIVGETDTIVTLQYYNSSGDNKAQYWTPFEQKDDSFAVYFRVNMSGVMNSGRFNPLVNGPVSVRGDSSGSGGVLNWQKSNLILTREQYSINGGSFWSGTCYFPKALLNAGKAISYKFFIENDTQNGWENNIPERSLIITDAMIQGDADTTAHWVYFDDNILTSLKVQNSGLNPESIKLYQNFPNPFNPATQISFTLSSAEYIRLSVFNLLGEEIRVLENTRKNSGTHIAKWDGKDQYGFDMSSGVYLINLQSNNHNKTIKAVLIR